MTRRDVKFGTLSRIFTYDAIWCHRRLNFVKQTTITIHWNVRFCSLFINQFFCVIKLMLKCKLIELKTASEFKVLNDALLWLSSKNSFIVEGSNRFSRHAQGTITNFIVIRCCLLSTCFNFSSIFQTFFPSFLIEVRPHLLLNF